MVELFYRIVIACRGAGMLGQHLFGDETPRQKDTLTASDQSAGYPAEHCTREHQQVPGKASHFFIDAGCNWYRWIWHELL